MEAASRDSPEGKKLLDQGRCPHWGWDKMATILQTTFSNIQSTPVISRLLGAKIRERELSGSPVISRCRAKATTR